MADRLVDLYGGLVCDLDGVVYRGAAPVPHAVESLGALGPPVVYATNNASRPPGVVVDHLRSLGLVLDTADVVTSAQAGAAEVARHVAVGSPVLAIGGPGVTLALTEQGLQAVTPAAHDSGQRVAAVLQGYGPKVTAGDLAQAAYAIQEGARWVATNTDQTLPTDRGVAPGNGMMVAAVRRACGVDPTVVGKPEPALYVLCADRLGQPVQRLLAIGDRLDTDIAGAVTAGADSVLVLTGVDDVAAVAAAPPAMRPTYLVEDLRSLLGPYAAVRAAEYGWTCSEVTCHLAGGVVRWSGEGSRIERARALLGALHAAVDAGTLSSQTAATLAAADDRGRVGQ